MEVGVVHLVVLDRLLKATTKKGRQLFGEKSAPPDKILATPIFASSKKMYSPDGPRDVSNIARIPLVSVMPT